MNETVQTIADWIANNEKKLPELAYALRLRERPVEPQPGIHPVQAVRSILAERDRRLKIGRIQGFLSGILVTLVVVGFFSLIHKLITKRKQKRKAKKQAVKIARKEERIKEKEEQLREREKRLQAEEKAAET